MSPRPFLMYDLIVGFPRVSGDEPEDQENPNA